ncbi:P-loop containing nucleoside triphosphate hydrolase protein [Dendrothele bispora CBS 962.96]|uniref:P-loop containing nucleoside triphosphate hydrolase protein n=1 Tax=Dendrothele bispora (strain CBS 962.96) TaxID=1314807 RepID=A0A4S8L6Y8_DENBC|nr:P-loop containing nucleoside triphosphate hydrolase protein [Dendrothele bispora CBS 962.96]
MKCITQGFSLAGIGRQVAILSERLKKPVQRLPANTCPILVHSLASFLPKDTNQSAAVGVSMSQDEEGIVEFIAFATTDIVFLIDTSGSEGWGRLLAAPNANSPFLASFDMPRVALRLFAHLGHHVRGIDLSTFRSSSDTETLLPGKALSDRFQEIDQFKVNRLWHENSESEGNLCLRAWLSAKLAEACSSQIQEAKKVDTRHVRKDILPCFAELLKQTDILAKALPRQMISEYDNFTETVSSSYQLTNSRYKTRVRKSAQVIVTDEQGREHQGRASGVRGKKTSIKFDSGQQQPTGPIRNIRVIGLDEPTNAEKARKLVLLKALRGDVNLIDCDFIRFLWFPTPDDLNDSRMLSKEVGYEDEHYQPQIDPFTSNLNDSQREVVKAMISCQPMIIVHGPPGTGKTTTISSAARYWSSHDQPVWIIGHSNVSVKNIAEKLWKEDTHFKLIVSKEFYVEWHEHIYEGIVKNVIQGDEMPTDPGDMKNVLEGAKIVLSTLGMLSSPVLDRNRTFSLVPVERLIVDEASQINTFEYLAVFHKFHRTLKKVCFFGDPKQLPPFGQDKAQSLKCIFDVEHLQNKSYFLDTQYRMPIPLGKFISTSVYSGGLKSEHQIDDLSCVSFVNVQFGLEWKTGTSWTNLAEIGCISNLVRHYYGSKNFCIITPYDGQRSAIESVLKAEGLPWDRVFNVDSFQGELDEYAYLSFSHWVFV